MKLRLSKAKFWGLIISAFLVGFAVQGGTDFWIRGIYVENFLIPIFMAIFLALFIGFLHIVKLKNKIAITLLSILTFAILNFFIFLFLVPVIEGGGLGGMMRVISSELYIFLPTIGFLIAVVVGLIYGLYIAFNLDKKPSKLSKRSYIIYGAVFGVLIGSAALPIFSGYTLILGALIGWIVWKIKNRS